MRRMPVSRTEGASLRPILNRKSILWSPGSMLIDYTSKNGDKLQGALYLPGNYEKSKSYPTIVYYYETRSKG